jgi:hypothetical protein
MTRGRAEPVEEILPRVWQVIEELKRLTEGLEQSLEAARKKGTNGPHDT